MKDLDVKSNSDKARDYTKEPPQYMRSTPRLDNIPIFSESSSWLPGFENFRISFTIRLNVISVIFND
jgi:hypothetical protein